MESFCSASNEQLDEHATTLDDVEIPDNSENEAKKQNDKIAHLETEVSELKVQLANAEKKNKELEEAIRCSNICIENIDEKDIPFYTGFLSREVFNSLLEYLNSGPDGENLVFVRNEANADVPSTPVRKIGRPRKLDP